MEMFSRLLPAIACAAVMATPAMAQQADPVGDKDDQIVITGCVMRSIERGAPGQRSLLVWAKDNVFLEGAIAELKPSEHHPVGTAGPAAPVFYWIDDEDDIAKHLGHRVEIVGELSDEFDRGEIDVEHKGTFTEIEFEWDGRDVKAQVPSSWFGLSTPRNDTSFDIAIRRVDVEKVTPLTGTCS